jgi:pimeloyl-ACP methyl ester carboxylesterase
MRALVPSLAVGAVVALAACADSTPLGPIATDASARTTSEVEPTSGPWARVVSGETGPGSLYQVYVPTGWNGDVIYFVHGIIPPTSPVELPDSPSDWDGFATVRDQLGALGYAFAYSSFSENGLALKDAAQRTHQLRGLVASELKGQPERSFLVGYSLGSAAALHLAEQFPQQYDGALLACGMIGGTQLELEYIGHVRALFDHYYPGVMPGTVIDVPEGGAMTPALQAQIVAAITPTPANPTAALGLLAIASTAQTPLAYVPGNVTVPGVSQTTLVTSLIAALSYQLFTWDVVARTHGHSPFDNSATTYTMGTPVVPALSSTLSALIAGSNVGVDRYTSPPDAQNVLEKYFTPSGALEIPVITVHNRWDYLVPFFHEAAFQQTVAAAGASDMLLQRALTDYGHCSNTQMRTAVTQGLLDLVGWVDSGVRPAS